MNATEPCMVCATDFSPRAKRAAVVAAKLAHQRSQDLQLIHVTDSRDASMRSAVAQRLETEAGTLRKSGAKVEALLIDHRDATEGLLAHIRRTHPLLVVIASGAKGALDRWTLGSFSERIAEASPVPTLVIRNPAAFEAW